MDLRNKKEITKLISKLTVIEHENRKAYKFDNLFKLFEFSEIFPFSSKLLMT